MKKFLVPLLCLFLLASCAKNTSGSVDYEPYAEIPADYSLDSAKADHLVIYENTDITSGQSVWDEFVKKTQKGTSCMVRLGFYFTLDDASRYDPDYYEEIKDDYPKFYVQDLSFDGKVYTLYSIEEDEEYTFTYKYLKRFEEIPQNDAAIYSKQIRYVLVNDNEVTWEQIFESVVSSVFGDSIHHATVYSKYIYDNK